MTNIHKINNIKFKNNIENVFLRISRMVDRCLVIKENSI